MKYRVKFSKNGPVRFVGHLDMMRYFQKAIRRAGLPIKYSEGFNPHQIMSFAAPLGVGVTSDGEYMDIELTERVSSEATISALNETMVSGVMIHSVRELPEKCENAMASLSGSDYIVTINNRTQLSNGEIIALKHRFFDEADEIIIEKQTKKAVRELDLKPYIYSFDIKEEDGILKAYMLLSTGSTENIKPQLVLDSMFASASVDLDSYSISIHKIDMYTGEYPDFISLGEIGSIVN